MGEPCCRAIRPLLSAWLDGELPADKAATVGRHCAGCASCEAERQGLAAVRSLVRSLPVRALPEGLAMHAAAEAGARRRRLATAGTSVAVTVGLLAGTAFALGGQPPPDARTVQVPMDTYVADHLSHSANGPLTTPALGDGSP